MERGFLVIVRFVEMTCDWVWSFHLDVIKMFFPSFYKRSSCFANILFLALVASQYIYHVVDAAIDVFWTTESTPVTVHVIWFVVFNSRHHVQFGFGHLFRRSFRSFTVWIGFKRLAHTSVSCRFWFLRYARIGVSGNSFLHSGDRFRTGQCLLMIFIKFGLSGLYVRTNGILCVPSSFVFVPWISSWWSWLRAFGYDSSMISSG